MSQTEAVTQHKPWEAYTPPPLMAAPIAVAGVAAVASMAAAAGVAAAAGLAAGPHVTQTRIVVMSQPGTDASAEDVTRAIAVEEGAAVPTPAPGKLLVRLTARPVHPADIMLVKGSYPGASNAKLPAVPGYEGTGVVEDANNVEGWAKGERVHAVCDSVSAGQGSWQQFVVLPPAKLHRVPHGMAEDVAAQSRGNPATALGMLETLAPPAGERVIQTAAASTLGRMFIALAKMRGVRTVNIIRMGAGREAQLEELASLGADLVLASDTDDIVGRVREVTSGVGAWGAVDAVGGALTQRLMSAVREGGTVLVYGALAGNTCTCSVMDMVGRDVKVNGFMLTRWLADLSDDQKSEAMDKLDGWLMDGSVPALVAGKYALADAKDAIMATLKSGRSGKVILMG